MRRRLWALLAPVPRDRAPLLVVLALYALSCLLPAGRPPGSADGEWENTYPGAVLLINGFTWFCGCLPLGLLENVWQGRGKEVRSILREGLVNWPPWLANPLLWCGAWQFRKGEYLRASALGGLAAVLAAAFFGSQWIWEHNIGKLPAYYVWAATPVVLAVSGWLRRTEAPGGRLDRREAVAGCLPVCLLALSGALIGGGVAWASWDPVARDAQGRQVGVSMLGAVLNTAAGAARGALVGAAAGIVAALVRARARTERPGDPPGGSVEGKAPVNDVQG